MHRLMKQNSEPEIDPTEMPKCKSYSMKNKQFSTNDAEAIEHQ